MRIKRGEAKRAKHKKVLKLAEGYRMSYHKLYRRAKEAVRHAGAYSYAHRRHRRAQVRVEWIKIISAELTKYSLSYSKFINALKVKNVNIDRKNLAELIIYSPKQFEAVMEVIK